jgi:hypothetical protein
MGRHEHEEDKNTFSCHRGDMRGIGDRGWNSLFVLNAGAEQCA